MSTIELPTYVPAIPLPAPVTSGSGIQTYTDPYGDVWVAANGVNGGAWRRARDVLHARYWRSAAFSITTGWTNLNMDTVVFDDYGLYSSSTGLFTPPILGMWQLSMQAGATATATGQWLDPGIWQTSSTVVINAVYYAAGAGSLMGMTGPATRRITSLTDTYYCRAVSNAALAAIVGTANNTWFEAHYLGTG